MEISDSMTIVGFAWIDDDTNELNWAYAEDLANVSPQKRPRGCTPVVIEIHPAEAWAVKAAQRNRDFEFLGDLQAKMMNVADELSKLEKTIKAGDTNG